MKKRYFAILPLAIVAALCAGLWNFGLGDKLTLASSPQDCNDNAIVRCGIQSVTELRQKFNSNHRDIKHIYGAFGVTAGEINNATIKMGRVYKNGNVTINGDVVATGAVTVGRQNMPGSHTIMINDEKYYERAPSVSFRSDYINAFVMVDKYGKFLGAVITSCGNPVKATPKPKPYYVCTGLIATPVAGRRDQINLAIGSELNDVTFLHKTYTIKNSAGKVIDTIRQNRDDANPVYTQPTAGRYSVEGTVTVNALGKTVTTPVGKCKASFTIEAAPEYRCDSLTLSRVGQSATKYGQIAATVKHTEKNGAKYKSVTYKITGPNGQTITATGNDYQEVIASPGKWRIEATVNFTVDGKTKNHTSAACKAEIDIPKINEPVYTCDELTQTIVSRLQRDFTVTATAKDGATIKEVKLDFGDQSTDTKPYGQKFSHTYAPGNYTAVATVTFVVNGKEVKKTGPECSVPVAVAVNPQYACTQLTYVTANQQDPKTKTFTVTASKSANVTIKEVALDFGDQSSETKPYGQTFTHTYQVLNNITAKATVTFVVEGQEVPATSPACTVTFSTLGEEECKPGVPRYLPNGQPNPECEEVEECKPGIPVGSPLCEEECKPGVPKTVNGQPNPECEEEEAPQVLAATGPEGLIAAVAGTGALGYAIQNFTASRRALRKATFRK